MTTTPGELTRLLEKWIKDHDENAFDEAVGQIHQQLKRAAHNRRASFPNTTIQTTELVSEAFIKLIPVRQMLSLASRQHFVNLISHAIKRYLQEEVRRRGARKRGPQKEEVPLNEAATPGSDSQLESDLAILEALEKIRMEDPILYQVIHYRHFMGFTIEETALELEIPSIQVNRKWAFAKSWLFDLLTEGNRI